MNKTIDLHVHSTASDGTFTPTELVAEAKRCGLSAFALTDHDTVDGISGATLTSTGVEKSINYWMGPQGYGQFLQRLASDRNNLNL